MDELNNSANNIKERKGGYYMEQKYNTGDEAGIELKKALRKSTPRKFPNMSDAEMQLKFKRSKS